MKNDNLKCKITEELSGVQNNVSLAGYNTFKIGGLAKYFFLAGTKEEIIKAIKEAKESGLSFFILGGGSNLLFSDEGYDGLVIKISNQKIEIITETCLECEAGTSLAVLVNFCFQNKLTGIEWAAGVPGTVGGAIRGNAGAFAGSLGEIVVEVESYNAIEKRIEVISQSDCQFAYRNSIFKHNPQLVILSAKLAFKKGEQRDIEKKMEEYLKHRQETQPMGFPCAGSIFKNPPGASAGRLIEESGLKGRKIGGAEISSRHANFIVNSGGAAATDIKDLINLIKKEVGKKSGAILEEEIEIIDRIF